mmetsp:Transcript_4184/g.10383  ORF Transcript_4184/g.10383 Transcript_4184/m.10383 type:complete len:351 (-) Transcript_4184:119-1171(-)
MLVPIHRDVFVVSRAWSEGLPVLYTHKEQSILVLQYNLSGHDDRVTQETCNKITVPKGMRILIPQYPSHKKAAMDKHYGNRMTNNDSPQTTNTSTSQTMPKTVVAPVVRRKNTPRRHHRRGRTPPKWLRNDHNNMCGELTMITGLETLPHLGLHHHHRHHRHHWHHQPRHPKNTVSTTHTNTIVGTLPSLSSSSFMETTQNNHLLRWQQSLDGILSNDTRTTLSFPSIEWDGDEGNESQEETLGGGGGLDGVSDHHIHHQFSSSSSSLSYGCTMSHHDDNGTMRDDDEEEEDECYRSLNNLAHGLLELSINLPPHNRRRHHHSHDFPPHHHPFLHRTLAFDSNLSSLGQA